MYKKYLKRCFDFIFALMAFILLSPLFLLLMLLIHLNSSSSIFFKQARIGKDNQPFQMIKFRTMIENAPINCPTHLFDNPEAYITKIGQFLRKTSLDELPQLINIIKGDMSFIGPRPSLVNQLDLIRLRNENGASALRPGITGLAQVNGRDQLSTHQKAELDGIYSQHVTLLTDLNILLRTISTVITQTGYKEGK